MERHEYLWGVSKDDAVFAGRFAKPYSLCVVIVCTLSLAFIRVIWAIPVAKG